MPETKDPLRMHPEDFHTGNFLADQAVKAVCNTINKADINHNHVPDIQEFGPVFVKLAPILVAASHAIDWKVLAEEVESKLAGSKAVKDSAVLKELIGYIGELGTFAAELMVKNG